LTSAERYWHTDSGRHKPSVSTLKPFFSASEIGICINKNKTMGKNKLVVSFLTVVVAVVAAQFLREKPFGASVDTVWTGSSTATLVKVASVSTQLLAENLNRKFVLCQNREGGSGDGAWVMFGSTASVGGGFYLRASQSFTIDDSVPYFGVITAVNRLGRETGGSTASSSVRITCQQGL
jgi:hypothetical protein